MTLIHHLYNSKDHFLEFIHLYYFLCFLYLSYRCAFLNEILYNKHPFYIYNLSYFVIILIWLNTFRILLLIKIKIKYEKLNNNYYF